MIRHQTIWFEAGWFPRKYGFCPSEKAWIATLKETKRNLTRYPESAAATNLFQRRDTKDPVALVTVQNRPPRQTVELLAHEAMHVWRDIRKGIGERNPSSELEAYAIQNILSNLMTAYEKTRGPLFIRQRP